MGRQRKSGLILPSGVYRHGKKFRMRVYVGDQKRPAWHVFKSTTQVEFFREWSRYLKRRNVVTMLDVFERYEAQELPKKATDTQRSDRTALKFLRLAFGNLRPEDVKPSQIVAYIDARGKQAPIRANREIALLSHIFTKCRHWELIEHNPAQKLRYRNPERPRDRYVTNRELWRALRLAPPLIRYAMFLAVSTGLRRRDVLSAAWDDFGPEGLTITLSKSRRAGRAPKMLLFEWSRSLRRLYWRIASLAGRHLGTLNKCGLLTIPGVRLFNISEDSYGKRWARFQRSIVASGIERFQMKDLRAKYATDLSERGGNATRNLAHSSAATTMRHYQRKPTRVNTSE